jgi:hypothetical protein
MSKIKTKVVQRRQPHSYSDLPPPLPTVEPVLQIGDKVVLDYSTTPVPGTVKDINEDGTLVWFKVPVAVPGGGDTIALGVHRVVEVLRGKDRWVRGKVSPTPSRQHSTKRWKLTSYDDLGGDYYVQWFDDLTDAPDVIGTLTGEPVTGRHSLKQAVRLARSARAYYAKLYTGKLAKPRIVVRRVSDHRVVWDGDD